MFQFTQSVQLVAEPGEVESHPLGANVSNPRVAEVLFNIATLLEMQQANPYRIAAYRNAARIVLTLDEPVARTVLRGESLVIPGVGERLRRKIAELVTTGHMTFYDDLCEESLPEDVRALMTVPHVGPRTALRLVGQLGIRSVEQLRAAAHAHQLRIHYGFGPRREQVLEESAGSVLEGQAPAA
jgi:DNA polymerase/3'-5' exonuclease PolX